MGVSEVQLLLSVIGSVGGLRAIEYLINLKANRRKAAAEAAGSNMDVFSKQIDMMERRIQSTENDVKERSMEVRDLYRQLAEAKQLATELRVELVQAKYWRCNIANCRKRKPPQLSIEDAEEVTEKEIEKVETETKTEENDSGHDNHPLLGNPGVAGHPGGGD